jgi:tetratricopeptide (TPR) repeat protein
VTKIVNGKVVVTRAVSPEAYEHVTRALLYEEEERWDEAAAELQRALPFDADAAEVRAHLAELFVRLGRLDDAAEQVDESLRVAPTVDGWLASAHVRQARADLPGELEALHRAVVLVEDDPEPDAEASERAHLALADAQIVALDLDGAFDTCRRLVDGAPDTIRGRTQLAALGWARGAFTEAEAALRGALDEEPADIDARLLLAELQIAEGHIAEGKASFRDAIDRSETPMEIAEAYASWLAARGDRAEAAELADRFTSEGGDAETLLVMSRLERAAKRPERATALAEKALKLGAPPGKAALLLGPAAVDRGDRAAALALYLDVPVGAPERLEARLRAAEILRDDGKTAEAARILDGAAAAAATAAKPAPAAPADASGDAAAKPAPGDPAVAIAIARSLVDEKRGDAAMAARRLDDALGYARDDARLLLARAALEERRGDWRRALTFADKLLQKDRRSVEALNFLGFVAADHGDDPARALKRLGAAAALNPGAGAIIDSLGWAHFRTGDLDHAGVFLEQAGRLEPGDAEILSHLGDLYSQRQDRARALDAYRRALTFGPAERLDRELRERIRTIEAKSAAGR